MNNRSCNLSSTVASGDTLTSIAAALASSINTDTKLSAIGVTATSAAASTVSTSPAVVNIKSTSTNLTTYSSTVNTGATEVLALAPGLGVVQSYYNDLNELIGTAAGGATTVNVNTNKPVASASVAAQSFNVNWTQPAGLPTSISTIGDFSNSSATNGFALTLNSVTLGQAVSVQFSNPGLTVPVTILYTPITGDTPTTVMTAINSAINSNTALENLSISSVQGTLGGGTFAPDITITTFPTYAATSTSITTTPGTNNRGTETIAISGSIVSGDSITLNVNSPALSGGTEAVSYTAHTGDTTSSIATALAAGVNSDSNLTRIGVSAAALASTLYLTMYPTYTVATSSGATETVTLNQDLNGSVTATIGGTKTTGDTITVIAHYSPSLGSGHSVTYTVLAGDTLSSIASNLSNAINSDGVSKLVGIGSADSTLATLNWSENFTGAPLLAGGTNNVVASATDGGGTTATSTSRISTNSAPSTPLVYDANGNMLSDGTNSYVWDIENRLITINYPGSGNFTSFTYDGFGNRVKVVESTGGSVTNTRQTIFEYHGMCEVRDAGGLTVSNQFFQLGESINGNAYFFTTDQLHSIRELIDATGKLQSQYSYDVYGQTTMVVGNVASDFQYAGYFVHARSGLCLSQTRAYSSHLCRWLSTDPIGTEGGGPNLYAYVGNSPTHFTDATGLAPMSRLADFMKAICNCKCVSSDQRSDCKFDAQMIADEINFVWGFKMGRGRYDDHKNESIGGYMCWDWAIFFYAVAASAHSTIWSESFRGWETGNIRSKAKPRAIFRASHYALLLSTSDDPQCQVTVEDGFSSGGADTVHSGSWTLRSPYVEMPGPVDPAAGHPSKPVQWP